MEEGRCFYEDEAIEKGRSYCYRILAEFAKTTPAGNYTYNTVESLPSEERCIQLGRDIPLMVNVDVLETDELDGQIEICWTKPVAENLDTLLDPGPYRYEVLRATGIESNPTNFQSIGVEFVSGSFANANDTCFVDTELNTTTNAYSYLVRFYVNNNSIPIGETSTASSVFLNIQPTDQPISLAWREATPWANYEYIVIRAGEFGNFDTL